MNDEYQLQIALSELWRLCCRLFLNTAINSYIRGMLIKSTYVRIEIHTIFERCRPTPIRHTLGLIYVSILLPTISLSE